MFTLLAGKAVDLRPRMSGGKESALIWVECEGIRYRLLASRELLEDEFHSQIADGELLPATLVDLLLPIFERMYAASDLLKPPEATATHKADMILTNANYGKYRT